MSGTDGSAKVILTALAANLGIAIAKLFGAVFSGSASMLAEAIHSFVDCTNQVLLLVGSKKAKRPPTREHPMGYGREAFFWSFIVAVLLFSLGGLFAIYEGVHKLSEHGEVSSPLLGLGILGVSLVLEGYSFKACIDEIKSQNPKLSLWQWFRGTSSSELLVIFTEDAAAMLGLTFATLSLLVSWLTGNAVWDAVGSILIGTVLVVVAVLLSIEIKSLIIGEAPREDFQGYIEEQTRALIPGGKVFHVIALQVGADEVMLSCKIHPGKISDVAQLIDAINAIERNLRQRYPQIRWSFFEPDLTD